MLFRKKNTEEKKKKSFWGRLLSFLAIFLASIILILGLFVFFLANSTSFRQATIAKLLDIINTQLIAKVEIEDIHLLGIGGIKLDGVRLITAGDTLANISSLIADVSFEPLLRNKLQINKLVLNSPDIRLIRSLDSIWNYNLIAPPSEPKPPSKTELTIRLKVLDIRSGKFRMFDSLAPDLIGNKFNSRKIVVSDLNLLLAANVNLGTNLFFANIKNLSAYESVSQTKLDKLAMKATIDTNGINVEGMKVKIGETVLVNNMKLSNFNVVSNPNPNISLAKVDVELDAVGFEQILINKFVNLPIDFRSKADISVKANGSFDDLDVKYLNIEFENSNISLYGKLRNITKPSLDYNLTLDGTLLRSKDLIAAIKKPDLSVVPSFKYFRMDKFNLIGTISNLKAQMNINSDLGKIEGETSLDFSKRLKYSAKLIVNNIDLSSILNNKSLTSNINAHIDLIGEGTKLEDLSYQLNISSTNSVFGDYAYNSLRLKSNMQAGDFVSIDTLNIIFPRNDFSLFADSTNDDLSNLSINANVDISNLDYPIYSAFIRANSVNLAKLLHDKQMPLNLTAQFELDGEGKELDEIALDFKSNFREAVFADRAMMPFRINASIKKEDNIRHVELKSNFVDLSVEGDFVMTDLVKYISSHGLYLSNFINEKLHIILPELAKDSLVFSNDLQNKIRKADLPTLNCELKVNVKDLSPVTIFVPQIMLRTRTFFIASILSSPEDSYFTLDTFKTDFFRMQYDKFTLSTSSFKVDGLMNIIKPDSIINFSYIDLNLSENENVRIGNLSLENNFAKVYYNGNILNYNAGTRLNKMLNIKSIGKLDMTSPLIQFYADSLDLNLWNKFRWFNVGQINISSLNNNLDFKNFRLIRSGADTIDLTGKIGFQYSNGLEVDLKNMPLADIVPFIPEGIRQKISDLKGNLKRTFVRIEGELANPIISASVEADSIYLNKYPIGAFKSDIKGRNGIFQGFAEITNKSRKQPDILKVNINSLPIYLGTDSTRTMFSTDDEVDITATAFGMPLQLIAPFVPNTSGLSGTADAKISMFGYLPDKFDFIGNAVINNSTFTITNTNITYHAQGTLELSKDKVVIDKITLKNTKTDLQDGVANVSGFVELENFTPGFMDLSITADKFLVLSDASAKSMPFLYGNFVIGTEKNPLRFFGTFDEPALSGDVLVWNAELKMPEAINKQIVRTSFNYEVKSNKKIYTFTSKIDSLAQKTLENSKKNSDKKDIAELINYDLNIRIKNFTVLIDMGALGEVYAKIGTRDPSIPMRYVKVRNEAAPKLYSGELELKEGSTLKIFRIMETKGIISFPTGAIDNPTLTLEARYDGSYVEGNTNTNYSVFVFITGTKNQPLMKLDYSINGYPATGDPKKIEEDAFILLATGKTKSSLGSGGGATTNLFDEGLNMGISQIASKSLTELLLGTGVIQSADVKFKGEGLEEAHVNFTGSFLGVANWKVGGNLADISSDYEVTLEYPISVQSEALNSFILQITRTMNMNVNSQVQDAKDFELKIKFGGSW